jgi:hypothetical protein
VRSPRLTDANEQRKDPFSSDNGHDQGNRPARARASPAADASTPTLSTPMTPIPTRAGAGRPVVSVDMNSRHHTRPTTYLVGVTQRFEVNGSAWLQIDRWPLAGN